MSVNIISALSGSILLRLVVMSSQSERPDGGCCCSVGVDEVENRSANPIRERFPPPRPPPITKSASTASSKNSSIWDALSRRGLSRRGSSKRLFIFITGGVTGVATEDAADVACGGFWWIGQSSLLNRKASKSQPLMKSTSFFKN